MSVYKGDFLGFQLGDEHSYDFNITRVSVSDRYNESLIPNFEDETSTVPGQEGLYYFNTKYTTKQFEIHFAFDHLTDADLRRLRGLFMYKGFKKLIFDEEPYKYYMVRPSQPPVLSYICFDELVSTERAERFQNSYGVNLNRERVYKGEGSVQLVAYYPYAKDINTIRILGSETEIVSSKFTAVVENKGDYPACLLFMYSISSGNPITIELSVRQGDSSKTMTISNLVKQGSDTNLLIDSRTQLMEGTIGSGQKTKKLYNRYITSGDFLKLPVGESVITSNIQFEWVEFTPVYF